MALKSIKSILAEASLVTPEQFEEWSKEWRVAVENGSNESLLGFFAREREFRRRSFCSGWRQSWGGRSWILPRTTITADAQKRICTKVAFQY